MTNRDNDTKCRRAVLQAGLAAIGGLVALPALASEQPLKVAQEKIAQNLVQYQTTPKDGAKCSTCVNYVEPNACKITAAAWDLTLGHHWALRKAWVKTQTKNAGRDGPQVAHTAMITIINIKGYCYIT